MKKYKVSESIRVGDKRDLVGTLYAITCVGVRGCTLDMHRRRT